MYKKLAQVKSEIGSLVKNANNPFFKSRYLDINGILDNLEPLLEKHQLLLLQPILNGDVVTEIIDFESGAKVESRITLPALNDPQKLGSAITYYRRYSLVSLLGLQAIDDDANLSVDKNDNRKVEPSKTVEKKPEPIEEIVLTEKHPKWLAVCKAVETGKKTVEEIADYYKCSEYIIGVLNMVSGKGEAVEVK